MITKINDFEFEYKGKVIGLVIEGEEDYQMILNPNIFSLKESILTKRKNLL